ncbi:MAG: hypothetical protein WCJ37_20260 [Syntrophus sp. (in: bacteria)]
MNKAWISKGWKPVPELSKQIQDDIGFLACPNCNAFLGEVLSVKSGRLAEWQAVPRLSKQFGNNRTHLTCPKCDRIIGIAVWGEPANAWEKVKFWTHYTFASIDGGKRRVAMSAAFSLLVMGFLVWSIVTNPLAPVISSFGDLLLRGFLLMLIGGVPGYLLAWFPLEAIASALRNEIGGTGRFEWWLYD